MPRPIGIVVAFKEEIAPFLKQIDIYNETVLDGKKFYEATYNRLDLVIAICSLGKKNAVKTTITLVDKYFPRGIISAGFSGATIQGLKAGVVILPEQVLDLDEFGAIQETIEVKQDWWKNQLLDRLNFSGTLICSEKIVIKSERKLELGKHYHAVMVDMESAGVLSIAKKANIPFCAIRVISDIAEENLPFDFNQFIDEKNQLNKRKLLFSLMVHPYQIPDFYRLFRNTRSFAQHLCGFLYILFEKPEQR